MGGSLNSYDVKEEDCVAVGGTVTQTSTLRPGGERSITSIGEGSAYLELPRTSFVGWRRSSTIVVVVVVNVAVVSRVEEGR